jgi:hypothetical protein
MLKVATLIWIMLGTTLAGIAVLAVLATPSLAGQSLKLIPIAALAGAIVALPISAIIAKKFIAGTNPSA